MKVPESVILIWAGTNASIPSGWSRETSLDGKFSKAWGTESPDTNGGAATHSHTTSVHTHSINSHTHSGTTNAPSGGSNLKDTAAVGGAPPQGHNHGFTSGGTSGNSASSSPSWGSTSNNPPYYETIFIKAGIGGSSLETNILALWAGFSGDTTVPTNWYKCDGTNGTPNLTDKFIRGAGSGSDSGTTGGATTHTHTSSHSHTVSHNHTGTTGGPSEANTRGYTGGGANNASIDGHTHTFTLSTANETTTSYSATSDSQSNEPAYKKIMAIMKSSSGTAKKGLIGLWLGTTSSIPNGWALCDGNNGTLDLQDKFIKITNTELDIGSIGGSDTHSHGSTSHNHTISSSHSHTCNTAWNSTTGYFQQSGGSYGVTGHYHYIASTSSTTTTINSSSISASSTDDNQPEYVTVAYIQLQKLGESGAFLLNLV